MWVEVQVDQLCSNSAINAVRERWEAALQLLFAQEDGPGRLLFYSIVIIIVVIITKGSSELPEFLQL